MSEEDKKTERMKIIYKALEEGWTVKKTNPDTKTFEFSKNNSTDPNFKGLVIYSNSELLNKIHDISQSYRTDKTDRKITKSASVPIFKN
jgi:hypothetical protein